MVSIYELEHRILIVCLRRARLRANITQEDLARRLGHTQGYVSKYEQGQHRLCIVELRAICEILGISLTDFVVEYESCLKEAYDEKRQGEST